MDKFVYYIKNKEDFRNIFILVFLTIAVLLPFCNRAFFIDDYANFLFAKSILHNPLYPYNFNDGKKQFLPKWIKGQSPILPNPPFFFYLLAVSIKLFNENIFLIRSSFLFFPVISIVCMYILSRKYTKHAMFSSLLLLFTPTFLVTSIGLLVDSVLLSFFLLSFVLFDFGYEEKKRDIFMYSFIIGSLAFLTKYTAFSLMLIFLFYLVIKEKKILISGKYLFAFVIPIIFFALWNIWNILTYGELHLLASFRLEVIKTGNIILKMIVIPSFLSGSLIFIIFSIIMIMNRKNKKIFYVYIFISFLLFKILSSKSIGGYTLLQSIMITLFVSSSYLFFFLIYENIKMLINNKINLVFIFWFIVYLLVIIKSVSWTASRYYLIVLPPLILIFSKLMEKYFCKKLSIFKFLIIFCNFIFGIMILYADYVQSNVYKILSYYVNNKVINQVNRKYYLDAITTGIGYYMQKIGWESYQDNIIFQKGDYLLIPKMISFPSSINCFGKVKDEIRNFELVDAIEFKAKYPIRVFSTSASAGFYGSFIGTLPFSFSNDPLEVFYLYRKI